jgi:hypothetical protein
LYAISRLLGSETRAEVVFASRLYTADIEMSDDNVHRTACIPDIPGGGCFLGLAPTDSDCQHMLWGLGCWSGSSRICMPAPVTRIIDDWLEKTSQRGAWGITTDSTKKGGDLGLADVRWVGIRDHPQPCPLPRARRGLNDRERLFCSLCALWLPSQRPQGIKVHVGQSQDDH